MPARPSRRRGERRLRPTTFGRSILFLVVVLTYVALDGEPTLVAVATLLVVVLALAGTIWPVVTVARVQLALRAPADAVAGEPVTYRVEGTRLGDGVEVRLVGQGATWVPVVGPGGRASASLTRARVARGVYIAAEVDVRASGPVGLVERTRSLVLPLPAPLTVAPRPFAMELEAEDGLVAPDGVGSPSVAEAGDAVRSVRPYAPGDPARLVHWPSTARSGQVVVREMEPLTARRVAVLADLSDGGPAAELVASAAVGVVATALAQGVEVLLLTAEDGQPVISPVRTTLAAGRRLALASPGPTGRPPDGWDPIDVRAWVARQRATGEGPFVRPPTGDA